MEAKKTTLKILVIILEICCLCHVRAFIGQYNILCHVRVTVKSKRTHNLSQRGQHLYILQYQCFDNDISICVVYEGIRV